MGDSRENRHRGTTGFLYPLIKGVKRKRENRPLVDQPNCKLFPRGHPSVELLPHCVSTQGAATEGRPYNEAKLPELVGGPP